MAVAVAIAVTVAVPANGGGRGDEGGAYLAIGVCHGHGGHLFLCLRFGIDSFGESTRSCRRSDDVVVHDSSTAPATAADCNADARPVCCDGLEALDMDDGGE